MQLNAFNLIESKKIIASPSTLSTRTACETIYTHLNDYCNLHTNRCTPFKNHFYKLILLYVYANTRNKRHRLQFPLPHDVSPHITPPYSSPNSSLQPRRDCCCWPRYYPIYHKKTHGQWSVAAAAT